MPERDGTRGDTKSKNSLAYVPVIFGPPTNRVSRSDVRITAGYLLWRMMLQFTRQPLVYGHSHARNEFTVTLRKRRSAASWRLKFRYGTQTWRAKFSRIFQLLFILVFEIVDKYGDRDTIRLSLCHGGIFYVFACYEKIANHVRKFVQWFGSWETNRFSSM